MRCVSTADSNIISVVCSFFFFSSHENDFYFVSASELNVSLKEVLNDKTSLKNLISLIIKAIKLMPLEMYFYELLPAERI